MRIEDIRKHDGPIWSIQRKIEVNKHQTRRWVDIGVHYDNLKEALEWVGNRVNTRVIREK